MSTNPELTCPVCAAELSIEQLFAHAETRQAFARLAAISLPLGSKVLAYVALFAPAKNRMTIPRKVKLIEQLLPDLVRGAIERKGREWQVSHDDWRTAIDQVLDARDSRKISLPLTSHGYLYEVLCGLSDKTEASDERQAERERRERPVHDPIGAGPVAVSAALAATRLAIPPAPPPTPGTSPLVRRMLGAQRRAEATPSEEESQ